MKLFSRPDEIKMATIGYSPAYRMGFTHLSHAAQFGAVPTAVCDMDEARLAEAQADFPGIHTYKDLEEMLAREKDLKLIAIITPHNTHHRLAMRCLDAGLNVVVEKPFAVTTEETDQMLAAARAKDLVVTAYHNRHWDGAVIEALKHVQGDEIGDVVRIEAHMGRWNKPLDWWRSSRSISGGVLYDWGVHLLDYCFQLLPHKIVEVSGYRWEGFWNPLTHWQNDTNEDEASALVRFDNGSYVNLRITSVDSDPRPGVMQITGTKGSLRVDHGGWERTTRTEAGTTLKESGGNPENQWIKFYENLIGYLTGKAELVITPEWSQRTIRVIDMAVKSAGQGRAMAAEQPF